jgi:hypothetical protein
VETSRPAGFTVIGLVGNLVTDLETAVDQWHNGIGEIADQRH